MMRKLMNISPAEVLIVLCILCIVVLLFWPIYARVTSQIPGCPNVYLRVEEDGVIIMSWLDESADVTGETPRELRRTVERTQRLVDSERKERMDVRREAKQRIRKARSINNLEKQHETQ